MRLEPGRDGLDIVIRGAESRAEFLRRHALVIVWRRRILLFTKELGERGLLFGSAPQHELNVFHREIRRGGALVKFCSSKRMRIAVKHEHLAFVDWSGDERTGLVGLRRR